MHTPFGRTATYPTSACSVYGQERQNLCAQSYSDVDGPGDLRRKIRRTLFERGYAHHHLGIGSRRWIRCISRQKRKDAANRLSTIDNTRSLTLEHPAGLT